MRGRVKKVADCDHLFLLCLYENGFLVLQRNTHQLPSDKKMQEALVECHPERRNLRREFPELMSHHILRYGYIMVYFAVMYLKL